MSNARLDNWKRDTAISDQAFFVITTLVASVEQHGYKVTDLPKFTAAIDECRRILQDAGVRLVYPE